MTGVDRDQEPPWWVPWLIVITALVLLGLAGGLIDGGASL